MEKNDKQEDALRILNGANLGCALGFTKEGDEDILENTVVPGNHGRALYIVQDGREYCKLYSGNSDAENDALGVAGAGHDGSAHEIGKGGDEDGALDFAKEKNVRNGFHFPKCDDVGGDKLDIVEHGSDNNTSKLALRSISEVHLCKRRMG